MSVLERPPAPAIGPPPAPPSAKERRSALLWTGVAVGGIWVAVVLISVFAHDNVSGSEHEHVPLAAILTWIWGMLASRSVAVHVIRRLNTAGIGFAARVFAVAVLPIWLAATLVSLFTPDLVSGTDPTRTPLAALIAPVGALVLTQGVAQLLDAVQGGEDR